jgi:hypothetical protein
MLDDIKPLFGIIYEFDMKVFVTLLQVLIAGQELKARQESICDEAVTLLFRFFEALFLHFTKEQVSADHPYKGDDEDHIDKCNDRDVTHDDVY